MSGRRADQTEAEAQRRPRAQEPRVAEQALASSWETLQRSIGNQAVRRLFERLEIERARAEAEQEAPTPVSPEIQERIDAERAATQEAVSDLPGVRLHSGPHADALARDLRANAFTQGRDIFLRSDRNPGTLAGRRTLAHELAHADHGAPSSGAVLREPGRDPNEAEASKPAVGPASTSPGAGEPGGISGMFSIMRRQFNPSGVSAAQEPTPQVPAPQPSTPTATVGQAPAPSAAPPAPAAPPAAKAPTEAKPADAGPTPGSPVPDDVANAQPGTPQWEYLQEQIQSGAVEVQPEPTIPEPQSVVAQPTNPLLGQGTRPAGRKMTYRKSRLESKDFNLQFTFDGQPWTREVVGEKAALKALGEALDLCQRLMRHYQYQMEDLRKQREDAPQYVRYWSDLFGGVTFPDDDWDKVGPYIGKARQLLDKTDAQLEEGVEQAAEQAKKNLHDPQWLQQRNLDPALAANPLFEQAAEEDAFDRPHEQRIWEVAENIQAASNGIEERKKLMERFVEGAHKGSGRAVTGIKVAITVLATADPAAEGGTLLGTSVRTATKLAFVGASTEFLTQFGQMCRGDKDWGDFDWKRIKDIGIHDAVTGFTFAFIGGSLARVFISRLGISSVAGQKFTQWLTNVGSAPLSASVSIVLNGAISGHWPRDMDDFVDQVKDTFIQNAIVSTALEGLQAAADVSGGAPSPAPVPPAEAPPEAPVPVEAPGTSAAPEARTQTKPAETTPSAEAPTAAVAATTEAPTATMPAETPVPEPPGAPTTEATPEAATRTTRKMPARRATAPTSRRAAAERPTQEMTAQAHEEAAASDPGVTQGPIEPGIKELPEGLIHYDLDAGEAVESYKESIHRDSRREAGIWVNRVTDEHAVVQGRREWVDGGWLTSSPEFLLSRGQEVTPDSWELLEHFHPGWGTGRQFFNRFPSPGDFEGIMWPQMRRGTVEPVTSRIRARQPGMEQDVVTEYGFDPQNLQEPFWIRYQDANGQPVVQRFPSEAPWNANSAYERFVMQFANAEPVAGAGGGEADAGLKTIEPEPSYEADTAEMETPTAPVAAADRPTQAMPAETAGPETATRAMPAQGAETAFPWQHEAASPEAEAEGTPPTEGATAEWEDVTAIDDPIEANQMLRSYDRSGRAIRLLPQHEDAVFAWRHDYRQPGEPPSAWLDGAGKLVVDASRVKTIGRAEEAQPAGPVNQPGGGGPPGGETLDTQPPAPGPAGGGRASGGGGEFLGIAAVEYTNDPVEAARAYHNALAEGNHVRVLGEPGNPGPAREGWQAGFGQTGDPPAAWTDLYGNVFVDGSQVPNVRDPLPPGEAGPAKLELIPYEDEEAGGPSAAPVTPAPASPTPPEPESESAVPEPASEAQTARMGKVSAEALMRRRAEGLRYIRENDVRFYHATNRAIVHLLRDLHVEATPWLTEEGGLWLTTDRSSPFLSGSQVSVARTKEIYAAYGVEWTNEAETLAREPALFEVDIAALPSPNKAADVMADFAADGPGRSGVNTDYTIRDLTASPLEAMTEISPAPEDEVTITDDEDTEGSEGFEEERTAVEVARPRSPDEAGAEALHLLDQQMGGRGANRNGSGGGNGGPPAGQPGPVSGPGPWRALGPMESTAAPGMSNTAELVQTVDRSSPLAASGSEGSLAFEEPGYGAFETRVLTERGDTVDAVVKIYPNTPAYAETYARDVAGAKAAALTGLGPPFWGEVTIPPDVVNVVGDDLAFAVARVPGGDVTTVEPDEPGYNAEAQAETDAALDALTDQAVQDVRTYGAALNRVGYYYAGEVQGLIGPDGRWRPIDFQGIEPLPEDPEGFRAAVGEHQANIDAQVQQLEDALQAKRQDQEAVASGGWRPGNPRRAARRY